MKFIDGINQLALEVKKKKDEEDNEAILKASLNFAKIEVGKSYFWKELKRDAELIVTPNYTSGLVSYTQNSRTVTGSGTVWTASMAGRYFKAANMSYWYRIAMVDASAQVLYLESAVIESSASSQTYQIWKRYYRVNSDIRLVLPDTTRNNLPLPFEVDGYDLTLTPYVNGTISATANSQTITGTSTAFFGNVYPGDLITIESDTYRIRSVDSDTQLTLTNKVVTAWNGKYSIESDTPYQADMSYTPSVYANYPYQLDGAFAPTQNTLTRYYYLRMLYPMVNDDDTTELSVKFDRCIMDFAKAEFKRLSDSPNWEKEFLIAQARLEKLKQDASLIFYPYQTFHPQVYAGNGRGAYRTKIVTR